jgi:hypothetical protein
VEDVISEYEFHFYDADLSGSVTFEEFIQAKITIA